MAQLYFKVEADYEKVAKLREEISRLESKLKSFGKNTPNETIKELENSLSSAKREFKSLTEEAVVSGATLKNAFSALKAPLAGLAGLEALKAFVGQVIRIRGEFQEMETSIETLVGSEMKNKLLPQIKELAKVSPLTMTDIVSAEKMMLGFNIEADKSIRFLQALSDVSMGSSQKFNSLTLAFSQMSATGKLMGQDLNQMINAGFNPLQQIAQTTGKSIASLKEEMSKGAISAEMVQQAFIDATSAGGKFYKMSENASKTINGQISMLEDAMDAVFNELGTTSEKVIVEAISTTTTLVQNYNTIGKVIGSLIATYGTYKASLAVVTAMEKGLTVATVAQTVATKAATVAQAAFNVVAKMNPYVLLATSIVGAVTAIWAFAKNTSEAQKEEERLASRLEKNNKYLSERQDLIEKNIAIATDELRSETERQEALKELQKIYPKVFTQFETYAELTDKKTEAQKAFNAELYKEKELLGKSDYKSDFDALKKLQRLKEIIDSNNEKRKTGQAETLSLNKEFSRLVKDVSPYWDGQGDINEAIKNLSNSVNKQMQEFREKASTEYESAIKNKTKAQLEADIAEYNKVIELATKQGKNYVQLQGDDFATSVKELRGRVIKAQAQIKSIQDNADKDFLKEAKLRYEESKAKVQKIINDRNNRDIYPTESAYSKALKEARDEEAKALKEYKKLGGDPTKDSKADSEAKQKERQEEKYRQVVAEQHKENMKQARKNKLEMLQLGLEMEQDSSKARLKQVELDYRLAVDEILEWEQRIKQAKIDNARQAFEANIENKGKIFDVSSVDMTLSADEQALLIAKWNNAYFKHNQDRKNAERENNQELISDLLTYEQQRLQIIEQFKKKRESLYETDENGNKTLKKGVTEGNVNELNIQEQDALKAVDETFAMRSEQFQAWADNISNIALWKLQEMLSEAQDELAKLEQDETADSNALAQAKTAVKKLETEINKRNASTDTSPNKKSIKDWNELRNVLQDTSDSFKELGDKIGGTAGEILGSIGSISSSVISVINSILQLSNTSIASINATSKATAQAIKTVETASVVLSVVSTALSVATTIARLFNGDKAKQKHIEALQERIDTLQWELDHAETMNLKKNQIDILNEVEKAYKGIFNQLLATAQETKQWASYSKWVSQGMLSGLPEVEATIKKIADYYSDIEYTANKALGEEKYRGTREQLEKIAQQQLLLQNQIEDEEDKKNPDESRIEANKQKIKELGEQALEVINQITEEIIGGSAIDIANDLADAFFEAFSAGEDYAKAWGDKVNDIVGEIVKRMLVSKLLEEPMGELFDKYQKQWFKDGEFQGVDAVQSSMTTFADDLNNLGSTFSAVVESLPTELQDILRNLDGTMQEASGKGIEALTQEQGEELNGRFTALQLAGEKIAIENELQTKELSLINITTAELLKLSQTANNALDGIAQDIANSYLELREINENTGETVKTLKTIQADIAEVKTNTSKL